MSLIRVAQRDAELDGPLMNNDNSFCNDLENYAEANLYDIALVQKILQTISSHAGDHLSPVSLRNSLLAVAGVLHLEAAQFGGFGASSKSALESKLDESFAECAVEQFRAVLDASLFVGQHHRREYS